MEIERTIKTKLDVNVELKGITLLSKEEVEKLPMEKRIKGCFWWLRSNHYGYYHISGCVDYDGNASGGDFVYYSFYGVVPALIYSSADLKIGDIFKFNGFDFEVIDDKYALCTTYICKRRFDPDSNDYKKSEIKKYLEEWFNDGIKRNGRRHM